MEGHISAPFAEFRDRCFAQSHLRGSILTRHALSRRGAVRLGIGVTFDHTVSGINPLGFGFGLRGDYLLYDRFRIGARTLYFVGGRAELPTGSISMQSWLIAVDGSYQFQLEPLWIEPNVALGVHVREIDGRPAFTTPAGNGFAPGSQNESQVGLYFAPGVRVLVPFSVIRPKLINAHAGIDTRLDLAIGARATSNLQLLIVAGVRF
jgi:hypothetical protein